MVDDRYATQRMSSWENNKAFTSYDPSQSRQHVPTISMPTSTDIVPSSRYPSQNRSELSFDGRQMQQFQQSKQMSFSPETLQSAQNSAKKTSVLKSCASHITATRVIGFIIGLVLTGVPLAVMVTLYVQPVTTTTGSTATTAGYTNYSNTNSLPYQCTTYSTNSDATRNVGYFCSGCYCDNGLSGWYRFTGSSGTRLATFPVSQGYCGASYTGWFNGTHSSTIGATTMGMLCVNQGGYLCYPTYSVGPLLATNCNGFYVYYLIPVSYCNTRYCTV